MATVWLGAHCGLVAATVQEIYSFPLAPNVQSSLTKGNDGAIYGTTLGGGAQGLGSVFRVTTNGAFATVVFFDGTNGAEPSETLLLGSDGALCGTTIRGGANDSGTVFSLSQQGALTTLATFEAGRPSPSGLFRGSDGAFYGTTYQRTSWNLAIPPIYVCSIFRLSTNQVTVVASFTVTNSLNNQSIQVQANDGAFYGTTGLGGSFNLGSVFRVATNGGLSTVFSFDGTNGGYVNPGLVQGPDGRLYGTTEMGGSNDLGVLFALATDGSLTDLLSFSDSMYPVFPQAPLIWGSDGALYGTSQAGGAWGYGDVFRLTTTGEMSVLGSFDQTNGSSPRASLVEGSDGMFYGTTYEGGGQGCGTVFRTTPAGTLQALASFSHPDAAALITGLVQGTNGDLYGTSYAGGTNNAGTLFRITTNGVEKALISFPEADNSAAGPLPSRLASSADGNFYGTLQTGGTNNLGTVFRMTEDGSLSTIGTFDETNGTDPSGGLLYGSDGAFYGTTARGSSWPPPSGSGSVFRVTTNGEITTLAQFFGTNGSYPNGDLAQDRDGNLYGTTRFGGGGMTNGDGGTLFRVHTNGELTVLFAFNGTNGNAPTGGLVQGLDGAFYGTTSAGGEFGAGTVFRITTNRELATLVDFTGTNGARPAGRLIIGPGGAFYGTTTSSYNGDGTLFRITTNGVLTTLASFDFSRDGGTPVGPLLLGQDGMLYGTALAGGRQGGGTIFRLSLAAQMQPLARAGKSWAVGFAGLPGGTYHLLRAANLSGPWETLTNLGAGDDGQGRYTDSSPPSDRAFYRVSSP